VKTTIDIDDDLFDALKATARERGTSMRAIVEEALRRLLTASAADQRAQYRLEIPVTDGRRPPTIDVDSNAAIADHLDATDATE
jgi:Arc/MetJ family transcription regulator